MVPVEHLLLDEAKALPALVVVRLPNGNTHFVVAWRRHGPFVQLMDPGRGRRWTTVRRFESEIYSHRFRVPAAAWVDWALGDEATAAWRGRLTDLGCAYPDGLLRDVSSAGTWRAFAALDASIRMTRSLVRGGAVRRGREAAAMLAELVRAAADGDSTRSEVVPDAFWSVRRVDGESTPQTAPTPASDEQVEEVEIQGAVLVRVRGCALRNGLGGRRSVRRRPQRSPAGRLAGGAAGRAAGRACSGARRAAVPSVAPAVEPSAAPGAVASGVAGRDPVGGGGGGGAGGSAAAWTVGGGLADGDAAGASAHRLGDCALRLSPPAAQLAAGARRIDPRPAAGDAPARRIPRPSAALAGAVFLQPPTFRYGPAQSLRAPCARPAAPDAVDFADRRPADLHYRRSCVAGSPQRLAGDPRWDIGGRRPDTDSAGAHRA